MFVAIAVAQDQPATSAVEKGVVGSWRSEDIGLDFPMWMVDSYAADGSVQTDIFGQKPGKPVYHSDKVVHRRWRIQNGSLEVGNVDSTNTFHRDGQKRPIKTDAAGKIVSIGGWTRVDPATTRPASRPSDGK